MPKIILKEPPRLNRASPPHLTSTTAHAKFYHPAYEKRDGLLFILHAYDTDDNDAQIPSRGGIHFGLALDACAIIADNRYDGWLTATPDGPRIEADWDDVLPAGSYWFHVPGPAVNNGGGGEPATTPLTPYRWPVVTSFQDFEFPEYLPPTWARTILSQPRPLHTGSQSTYSSWTRARDGTCRITNHSTGVQVAHICPGHEQEWFTANSMAQYNMDSSLDPQNLLNDQANLFLLRADLHAAFDDRKFVIYPKSAGADGFVIHMLQPTEDIGELYHNCRTQPIPSCRAEFLYARFAWSIFPAISGFLSNPTTNKAIITVKQTEQGRQRLIQDICDTDQLRARASASRSRSPKKRQRPSGIPADADQDEDLCPAKRARNSFTTTEISAPIRTPSGSAFTASIPVNGDTEAQSDFEEIKRQYLQKQRPPGFQPFTGSVFKGTNDPAVIFGRLGVEIREDSKDDINFPK